MSEDLEPTDPRPRREFPVIAGLIAMIAMIVVVGVVVGGGALVATRAAGLDGDKALDNGSSESATLFAPRPTDLENDDSSFTLSPTPETSAPAKPEGTKKPAKPEPSISLQAGQDSVAPMERIDLTGVYRDAEGAILRVQQFKDGQWADFPVTVAVGGGVFSTYIQASAVGLNRFRMLDTDTGESSNEIRVQIG